MKNPYIILGIRQDATRAEISKAKLAAMRKREYSLQEIAIAEKQLLDPAKRLAADFMFPSKIRVRRLQPIQNTLTYKEINLDALDKNAFDSLK